MRPWNLLFSFGRKTYLTSDGGNGMRWFSATWAVNAPHAQHPKNPCYIQSHLRGDLQETKLTVNFGRGMCANDERCVWPTHFFTVRAACAFVSPSLLGRSPQDEWARLCACVLHGVYGVGFCGGSPPSCPGCRCMCVCAVRFGVHKQYY